MYHVQSSDLPGSIILPLRELRQRSGLGGGMLHSLRLEATMCPIQTSSHFPCCEKFMLHQGFSFSLFCSYRQQYSHPICAHSGLEFWVNVQGITFKLHTTTCVSHSQSWGRSATSTLHGSSSSGPEGGDQHALAGLASCSVPHKAGPLLESWDQK